MKRLSGEIIRFFQNQGFVIVSTIDKSGIPHNSCKGIVKINQNGLIYLLDLYRGITHENLKQNSGISITAVDEHRFKGFCLKGRAKIISDKELNSNIIKDWERRLTSRITQRVVKNVQGESGHPGQPESLLPKPEYLIVMEIKEIVDLTPHHLK